MTNDVAVGAFGLNLIGETNESGNPFRVLFANDFVKRIAAHLPSGILLVRNDGESFRTYVEKVLVPTLREGDIVIMDNLGSHKGKAVRALIRSAGAKLFFLPKNTHPT